MKLVPLALLGLMVLTFIGSHWLPVGTGRGYLIAFSEAAMIGAMADWFAVVALFRHPLGIPIPHTAIIPQRKDQLGEALARFVRQHFLTGQVLKDRLHQVDLARLIAVWALKRRDGLTDASARLIAWLISALRDERYRNYLHEALFARLDAATLAPVAGRIIELAIENRHHQRALTEALRFVAAYIDTHEDRLREQIRRDSPWWMPGFVDDKIFQQMVERIQTQLLAMVLDPEHEMRAELDRMLAELAHRLAHSPEFVAMLEGYREQLVHNPALREYLNEFFDRGGEAALASLQPGAPLRRALRGLIGRLALGTLEDEALRGRFNRWLENGLVYIVESQGRELVRLITDTVRAWDGRDTARRIELAVGRDLQFIRINGTLVGGLIGVLLHAAVSALA